MRIHRLRQVSLLLFICFVSSFPEWGYAQEKEGGDGAGMSFRGTETFIAEYVGDNGDTGEAAWGDDDRFAVFRNLFYLQTNSKNFDSSFRFDAVLFNEPPGLMDKAAFDELTALGSGYTTLNYENDYRFERLNGTIRLGKLQITGGDFYASFGRGMALSLVKLDDIGTDNALRGARLEYVIPGALKALLVGGVVNSLNMDPITKQIQKDDPLDRILGARIEWEAAKGLTLAAHGVFLRPRFTDESQIDSARLWVDQSPGISSNAGGASTELFAGDLHVYLEGNAQVHDNFRPDSRVDDEDVKGETGYAALGEISYDFPWINLMAEGIYYKRWLMEGGFRGNANTIGATQPLVYHHLVTLEPMWMVIKSLGNELGGRLTAGKYFDLTKTQISLSTALIKYEGGLYPAGMWEDHPTQAVHPILKVRQEFAPSGVFATLEGGYRYEWALKDDPLHSGETGRLWHALADLSVPFGGRHSIEIKGEVRRHELAVTESNEYWVTMESIGYELSGLFGITAIHEYSDQTNGFDPMIGDWELPFPRRQYFWGLANIHAPAPLDGLAIRLLGGTQRGGLKCAGGICRVYPDAVGGKVEAVYRF